MLLEGWAAYVSFGEGLTTDWADHTWVRSPSNNQYFDCWGGHDGPNRRQIVSGDGSYRWANCYRCPVWPFRDTAGIGVYAVDGVCHQSTNCFLYTANRTLNFNVRGYWFSLFSYGTFGRSYLRWLAAPYGWCTWTTPRAIEARSGDEQMDEDEGALARGEVEEDPAISVVRRVYGEAARSRKPKHPHELLADEVAGVTEIHVPEVDFDELRDIQMDYLRKKDDLIARGHKEEQLAKRLDDLARQTQKRIAQKIGRERYERLMGMPAGEEVGLVEPGSVGMAGVPVPPPEALVEPTEEGDDSDPTRQPDEDAHRS
ncbi:MAG TPA: hypothetical protein VGW38_27960 [Chloroflexota bacterium]|nr:hypothetical protein [Chloroflexota bacterium]